MLCPGAILSGSKVHRSIISSRCMLHPESEVDGSILFSGSEVGRGARLKNTIVDKWIRIPAGESIGYDLEKDRQRFKVSETGIVVVPMGYTF